ncbi:XrtA system polysaccharide deacetylase [Siccirubricoccus phaeus]|nr:XrtA system polysaccharide deacetylase [Siccirubricoccus phaeus]
MSIDVEDWFQVQNYAGLIGRERWDSLPRRVEDRTREVLALFAASGIRATFFTLGWVAERHPALIRDIVAAGHELASHGYGHERVFEIGAARFREDVRVARDLLEQAGGVAVTGYRAPTFSVNPGATPWAHVVLAEAGYRYSSSIFPGPRAGGPVPLTPWRPHPDGVVELPMTALRLGPACLPVSGGGPFRATPHTLFAAALRRVNAAGRRGIFYFHPWEIDPDQPRMPGLSASRRLRHFLGLQRMAPRLARLLGEFAWGRVETVFAAELAAPTAPGRDAAGRDAPGGEALGREALGREALGAGAAGPNAPRPATPAPGPGALDPCAPAHDARGCNAPRAA